jgi:hypothetical protein
MKRFLIPALLFVIVSSAFALEPRTIGSSHAQSGIDSRDVTITMTVSPENEVRIWLSASASYPLLIAERGTLLDLVKTAARKIGVATANKTTITYRQPIGRFATAHAALVSVSFETQGYGLSYAVVQLTSHGTSETLLLNQKDTQDFISLLGNANSFVVEYERQAILFK